eukprot:scaffold39359_cov69-Phaeocystis_antarctica.AAC.1
MSHGLQHEIQSEDTRAHSRVDGILALKTAALGPSGVTSPHREPATVSISCDSEWLSSLEA